VRAELVILSDGGRVIVSRIALMADRGICFEIHRPEAQKFAVSHVVLTRDEAVEVANALLAISEAAK
jgi:hypothetical protein